MSKLPFKTNGISVQIILIADCVEESPFITSN